MERERGKNILSEVIKNKKTVTALEKEIYDKTLGLVQDTLPTNLLEEYFDLIYEAVGDVIRKKKMSSIIDSISSNNYGWKNDYYKEYKLKQEEQEDYLENPIQVEEGVLECKCGSKKVFSYSRQCRSADEPMTTFASCTQCQNKWTYSG